MRPDLKRLPISKKQMCIMIIENKGECIIETPLFYCTKCFLRTKNKWGTCTNASAYKNAIDYMALHHKEDLVGVLI